MNIDTVVWPVAPGSEAGTSRPARLVRAMLDCGLPPPRQILSHGRPSSNLPIASESELPAAVRFRSPLALARHTRGSAYASFTPLALQLPATSLRWMDAYDDWSIAPDVSRVGRSIARLTYASLRFRPPPVLTVNTPYMGARLNSDYVVPNGVDESTATLPVEGDDRLRVLILGSLHAGRLCGRTAARLEGLSKDFQVVVAGPNTSRLHTHLARSDADILAFDFLATSELAQYVGERTIALLPLRVSDYTLSQDPMKVYEFLALGIPIVMPRPLWPTHLPKDRAVLFDYDDDLTGLMRDAASLPTQVTSQRVAFASEHSWSRRARVILSILETVRSD